MSTPVIMLTGESCSGCKELKLTLETYNLFNKTRTVDAYSDEGNELVTKLGLRSIPVLISEGKPLLIGAKHTRETLEAMYV